MGIYQKAFVGVGFALLAACHRSPSGQVAATVDGEEITVAEVRLEMAGAPQSAEGQQAALQQLIDRKLLYKEAERQHLGDGPVGVAVRTRAEDAALAQLLGSKYASEAKADETQDALDKFIAAHPAQFAQRRLVSAEQLTLANGDAALLARINAVKTMPAVEALLTGAGIPFVVTQAVADTATMAPAVATKVAALTPDQIFVTPTPSGAIEVSRVLASRVLPLAGDQARTVARGLIDRSRGEAAETRLRAIVDQGQKRVWIDPSIGKT